ncbi:hypothetical protein [Microbacterium sp. G2-8]|uniref:hypothetical protein n=1 Tax=Microbacterium sp. G2-8 TaxID=2842454 RepID=UPI001C89690C|nr:hypothetical protein [Microbacterium sp. G2-8]
MSQSAPAADAVLTKDDRWTAIGTAVMAVIFGGGAVVFGVSEIVRIVSSDPVSLLLPFSGDPAQLPIGPGGEMREVLVESASVAAPGIPGISYAALIAEVVLMTLAILGVLACVSLLCVNISRGRVFTTRNTAMLTTASAIVGIGWAASMLLQTFAINGAFAAISDGDFDNVLAQVNFTPLLGVFVLGALAAAFRVGEKLQRDTEGLV